MFRYSRCLLSYLWMLECEKIKESMWNCQEVGGVSFPNQLQYREAMVAQLGQISWAFMATCSLARTSPSRGESLSWQSKHLQPWCTPGKGQVYGHSQCTPGKSQVWPWHLLFPLPAILSCQPLTGLSPPHPASVLIPRKWSQSLPLPHDVTCLFPP